MRGKRDISALTSNLLEPPSRLLPGCLPRVGQREETLQAVAGGKANTPSFDLGGWFNGLLYPLFAQGAFADPIYGGNRGKAVWKMIGYPGLPATYRSDVVTFRGKRHPKSDSPKSMEDFA